MALYEGNPSTNGCSSSNADHSHISRQTIVVIATAGGLAVLAVSIIAIRLYWMRLKGKEGKDVQEQAGSPRWAERKIHFSEVGGSTSNHNETTSFDLDDLLGASSQLLGKGQVGTTYKAVLATGTTVAVKRLHHASTLRYKDFSRRMMLLGGISHPNLTRVISFYCSKEEKLVTSEFVLHGTLFHLLHEDASLDVLDWRSRLSVAKGIVMGLDFLHNSLPSLKVPHANLKSSNILLSLDSGQVYRPKLADFGLFQLIPWDKLSVGKVPELDAGGGRLTYKADIYCFGIVLLELVTGRIPGRNLPGDGETTEDLSEWVSILVNTNWTTDILDEQVRGTKEAHQSMLKLIDIALACTDKSPQRRPDMSDVLVRIQGLEEETRDTISV